MTSSQSNRRSHSLKTISLRSQRSLSIQIENRKTFRPWGHRHKKTRRTSIGTRRWKGSTSSTTCTSSSTRRPLSSVARCSTLNLSKLRKKAMICERWCCSRTISRLCRIRFSRTRCFTIVRLLSWISRTLLFRSWMCGMLRSFKIWNSWTIISWIM